MKTVRNSALLTAISMSLFSPLILAVGDTVPPPVALPSQPLVVSGAEPKTGHITSIIVPTTSLFADQELVVHVMGSGKICRFHLVIINADTNKESYFPQADKIPVLLHANLNLSQFPYGNYKVAAMAWGTDKTSGMACQGGSDYQEFKIVRAKITLALDTPKITDMNIKPGKSSLANTYRTDEAITYSILGNVNNVDASNASKKCGWTFLLADSNGQSTKLGTGATFTTEQTSATLTAFKPGSYTLKAKTTADDDSLAPQSCLGLASRKITIEAAPGQIKDVKLEAWGVLGNGSDLAQSLGDGGFDFVFPPAALANALTPENGVLKITPMIDGANCYYRVTRVINDTNTNISYLNLHKAGALDKLPIQIYSPDQTTVQITINAGDTEKAQGKACDGSVTKTISVQDDPKLPKITK